MSILPPLLFGISASLDALLVGMALGLQKVPLPARHNLLISTVTLIGTVISIGLGNLLLPLFPIGIMSLNQHTTDILHRLKLVTDCHPDTIIAIIIVTSISRLVLSVQCG